MRPVHGDAWIWRLLVTVVVLHTAIMAIRPMASYRTLALGGDAGTVGLVAGAFGAISFVLAIPIGRAVDRGSPRRWIVAGAAIVVVAASLALASGSIAVLALSQALLGVGQIVAILGSQTLLTGRTPPERRAAWFGHYTFAASLGQFLGPTLGSLVVAAAFHQAEPGAVIPNDVTNLAFMLSVGGALVATLLALAIPEGPKRAASPPGQAAGGPFWSFLGIPGMRGALAASVAILIANDVTIAYLPVFGTVEGLPVPFVGLLLSSLTAAAMLSRLGLGVVVGRFGPGRALAAAVWFTAFGLILFPLVDAAPLQLGLIVSIGVGLGIGQPITLLAVASLAPVGARASALAMRVANNRLGQLVAPLAAGWVAGATNVGMTFWLMAGALGTAGLAVSRVRVLTRAMQAADETDRSPGSGPD